MLPDNNCRLRQNVRSVMMKLKKMLACVLTAGAMIVGATAVSSLKANAVSYPYAQSNIDGSNALRPADYIAAAKNGYMRVCYDGSKVRVEYYDESFKLTRTKTIKMELPLWGGFYEGKDNYYLILGKNNDKDKDGTEVVRIIKYTKGWKKVAHASIYAKNNWDYEIEHPFHVGCVNCTEANGKLYVATARQGYVDPSVGMGHQGMMLISVAEKDMTAKIEYGDFWHSFSQYITSEGNNVYLYEESEGSECTLLSKYDANVTDTDYFSAFDKRISVLDYGGERTSSWAVSTYATAEGIELSKSNILGIGTSIDQSKYEKAQSGSVPTNIYLTVTPKNKFTGDATKLIWLTNYKGDTSVDRVKLTKINNDRFLVTWHVTGKDADTASNANDPLTRYKMRYVFINGSGKKVSKVFTAKGAVSDCQPVVKGDSAVFTSSNGSTVLFYKINTSTGKLTKKVYRIAGNNATWKLSGSKLTISGKGKLFSQNTDDWSYENPWAPLRSKIKTIVIGKGITDIPDFYFEGIENLKNVYISDTVTSIGTQAFAHTTAPANIYIPSSVKKIGDAAFWSGWYWMDNSLVNYMKLWVDKGSAAEKYAKKNSINYENRISIKKFKAKLSKTVYNYTGKAKTPIVTLTGANGKKLKKGTDFTVTYKNNKKVGKGTVTIRGYGKYTGKITKTFKINPRATDIKSIASPASGKLKVTYNKVSGVTGYVIKLSTDKSFKKAPVKTVTVKGAKKTSTTVNSLKKGKAYYVKVRTFKTVNGKNYYSLFSTVKKLKVK